MKKKGFTLIELLAVIVVLAIILAVAVPAIGRLIESSKGSTFTSHKKIVEKAAKLYYETNNPNLVWEDNVSYVTVGELQNKKYLNELKNPLTNEMVPGDTKILLIKNNKGKIIYSLQLYDDIVMDWYRDRMMEAFKKNNYPLPIEIGQTTVVNLEELMDKGSVSELRLPLDITRRCVGYVEVGKTAESKYEYSAYVDCLTTASTFASHYVSYGGKYIDEFNAVVETSDGGFIAVGRSNSEIITKYGTGNHGKYDAIIVKFKVNGDVEWSKNFGSTNNDIFNAVVETNDGYVAVGSGGKGDGDLTGIFNGGNSDGIIVKYSKSGSLVYKRSYGSDNSANSAGTEAFTDIILDNNNYIIIGTMAGSGAKDGDLEGATLVRANDGIILKMDLNFNTIWRSFFVATYTESFNDLIKTSDNGYIVVGSSSSKDHDMTGIGYVTPSYQTEAIILKYNSSGQLQAKSSFRGTFSDTFHEVAETTDGYVAVGNSASSDYDMTGTSKASNGLADAIIVKYDKNLSNIIWKKSFGGNNDDSFRSVIVVNNKDLIAVGYSKSEDTDMHNMAIATEGYSNAIAVKLSNSNGNVLTKKVFGGLNSNLFYNIVETSDNNYLIAGKTFSSDYHLKNFNKGHSDSIVVIYDNNLSLIKRFQEPVVIIDKLKEIQPNYGTNIDLKYDNIYTSNDPTKDLLGWCTSNDIYTEGNTSNYYYGQCLYPFNPDDLKLLVPNDVSNGLRILEGENEYNITLTPNNKYNWHRIVAYASSSSGIVEWSNLKLKFKDGYVGHITDAINKGYIEPMVTAYSAVIPQRPAYLLPTVIDIINENGKTGEGSYPAMHIHIKPKKSEFTGIIMTSSKNTANNDGLGIYELRNFDMSITPTE